MAITVDTTMYTAEQIRNASAGREIRGMARRAGLGPFVNLGMKTDDLRSLLLGEAEPTDWTVNADMELVKASKTPPAPTTKATPTTPAKPGTKPVEGSLEHMIAGIAGEAITAATDDLATSMLASVDQKIDSKLGALDLESLTTVHVTVGQKPTVKVTGAHHMFEKIMRRIGAGFDNFLLVGPAGTGKSTLAEQVATALGLPIAPLDINVGTTASDVKGMIIPIVTGNGDVRHLPSKLVEGYRDGAVVLLDEFDRGHPKVTVSLNRALANGVITTQFGEEIKRHPKTVIIATANTAGRGQDREYVAAMQQDSATLDRFGGGAAVYFVDYDHGLERRIANGILDDAEQAKTTLGVYNDVRKRINDASIRRIVSPRLLIAWCQLIKAGEPWTEIRDDYLAVGFSEDDVKKIKPAFANVT